MQVNARSGGNARARADKDALLHRQLGKARRELSALERSVAAQKVTPGDLRAPRR
ncbi:MAG: hypothetical protein H6704_28970 [Myxococcales bacterium]|nr:hypothetical protein [Myxococcales bacterium]